MTLAHIGIFLTLKLVRLPLPFARWVTCRDVSFLLIALTLDGDAMASDGFHPGEPVYRVCGEALGRFIADELIPQETRT